MIVLTILMWILIIFLLLIAILVFAPVSYSIDGQVDTKADVQPAIAINAKASWMYLVRFFYMYKKAESSFIVKIGPYEVPIESIAGKISKWEKKPKKDEPSFKISDLKPLLTNLDIKSIIPLGIIMIKKMFKKIMPRKLNVCGVIGLDDPFSTVRFLSVYEAVSGAAGIRNSVDLRGDFTQKVVDMDLLVSGRFAIASLMWPVFWFVLQKPVRRGLFKRRRGLFKRKGIK